MKNYIRLIPLTGFAAAIALGGSLSAAEKASEGTNLKDQKSQSQLSGRTVDKTDQAHLGPMAASDILGMNIDSAADEKIGEIDEIFINTESGEVLAILVSTGGFLGMGQQQSLISPEDLRFNADRTLLQTDISKDQIRNAPTYIAGETNVLDPIRPLGNTRTNWDARKVRGETRPDTALGKNASYRATSEERSEMRSTDRGQNVSNRATASKERTERTNRAEGVQPDSRGLAVSDLIGMSVENRQGEVVGDVDEVFLDLENKEVVGVVVATGGFLGMGDRKTIFGLRELSFDPVNEKVLLDYNRDQVRAFPEFKPDDQSVFDDLFNRTDRLNTRAPTSKSDNAARTQVRDGGSSTPGRSSDMTVFDQGNSSEEIAMTASIRTAIRENDALSNRANNVTIITNKGKVVLRGEVDSASEKTTVEGIAQKKAGRQNVISELVVR